MKKIISILILILLIPMISGEVQTLGIFRQNDCIDLKQVGTGFSSCNITTVIYPNSSIALEEVVMTQTGIEYNYTFCTTSQNGQYIVSGFCHDGNNSVWAYDFDVNPTGTDLTTSIGIIYFIALIGALFVFALSLYGSIVLPWKHQRNADGYVIGVNELRYFKLFLIVFTYLTLTFIFGILRSITAHFLSFDNVSKFFELFYWIMIRLLWPILVVSLIVFIVGWLNGKKLTEQLNRGLPIK